MTKDTPLYYKKAKKSEDLENLTFHLKTGDYFAMLATTLGFLKENSNEDVEEEKLLDKLYRDVLYLHQNYKIEPRNK